MLNAKHQLLQIVGSDELMQTRCIPLGGPEL